MKSKLLPVGIYFVSVAVFLFGICQICAAILYSSNREYGSSLTIVSTTIEKELTTAIVISLLIGISLLGGYFAEKDNRKA